MRISPTSPRAGFTLVEMLVVLAILAALSTVALRSADGLQSRARYEATRKTLEAIETALLGSRGGLPGDVRAGGLLADTGRFLDSATITDDTLRFADLLRQPSGVGLSMLITDIDPDVRLATGWRGPYIRTLTDASTSTHVEDGWGNPIHAVFDTPTSRWSLVSAGADGQMGPGEGYDADLSITLPASVESATLTVTVNVTHLVADSQTDGDLYLQAFVFEPGPTDGTLTVLPPAASGMTFLASDLPHTVTFEMTGNLTTGPRIVRAYVRSAVNPGVPPTPAELRASDHKSALTVVTLLHGAQNLDLTIDR